MGTLQALSEYTPKLGPVVILPEEDMFLLTVTVAIDRPDSATTSNAIMVNTYGVLAIAILVSPHAIVNA
jgi:hypothetical protein